MAAGTKTFTGSATTEVLAADGNRDHYVLQLVSATGVVYFGFGEDAVAATGLSLRFPGDCIKVRGNKARLACNGIDGDSDAVVNSETMEEVEYISGQFAGPWPAS